MEKYKGKCIHIGCMYNDEGKCVYSKAAIKLPYARACDKDMEHQEE